MDSNQWISQPIQYEENYYIKDVLNELFKYIVNFVTKYDELKFDYEINTFKEKFYSFIYHIYYLKNNIDFEPYDEELYQYFSSKYSEDILNIFISYKELCKSYNINLFDKYGDTSLYLNDFLFDNLLIEDPYLSDESDIEEKNIDIYIDESEL